MIKLIKAIKLQRKLRVIQEVLFDSTCVWSQELYQKPYVESPYLNEYAAVNKAIEKINNKIPNIYFLISDIFGGASSIKKKSQEIIRLRNELRKEYDLSSRLFKYKHFDLLSNPGFPDDRMDFDYYLLKSRLDKINKLRKNI